MADTVYSQGFESGLDGWACADAYVAPKLHYTSHSGSNSCNLSPKPGNPLFKAISGMVAGDSHTATAWVRILNSRSVRIGVAEIGAGSYASIPTSTWTQIEWTFTATDTTHTLELWEDGSGGIYWDDILLVHHAPPPSFFVLWDGSSELPLTLDGVWDGSSITPVGSTEVAP